MKVKLVSVCMIVAAMALAQAVDTTAKKSVRDMTPEERAAYRAKMQAKAYQHTGGMLKRPGEQKGRVVYVNAQKKVPVAWLKRSAGFFADNVKITVDVEDGEFKFPHPKIIGNLTLFVIDDSSLPVLLAAPENRWAMVNVSTLGGVDVEEPFFQARVEKELTRGFCLLCGAINSNYPMAVVGPVVKVTDLDKFVDAGLPVDVVARFAPYLGPYGVVPYRMTTYKKACREGWAPAPTNDVQRAIFEQVKADKERGPTNPITIPPPNAAK